MIYLTLQLTGKNKIRYCCIILKSYHVWIENIKLGFLAYSRKETAIISKKVGSRLDTVQERDKGKNLTWPLHLGENHAHL